MCIKYWRVRPKCTILLNGNLGLQSPSQHSCGSRRRNSFSEFHHLLPGGWSGAWNPSESGGITPSAPGHAGMRRWEAMGGYAAVLHTVPVRRPQLPNKANALVMLGRQQVLTFSISWHRSKHLKRIQEAEEGHLKIRLTCWHSPQKKTSLPEHALGKPSAKSIQKRHRLANPTSFARSHVRLPWPKSTWHLTKGK